MQLRLLLSCLLPGLFYFHILPKINEAQPGAFKFKSEKIETNLFRRRITLNNAELTAQNSNTNIIVPKVKISGIKLLHLLFTNEMSINNFELSGSTTHLYSKKQQKTSADSTDTKSSSDKQVIKIKHLDINDLQFYYLDQNQDKPDTVFSTLLDFDVWNLNTDSTATSSFRSPLFQFDRVKLFAEKGELKVANGIIQFGFR